MSDRKIQQLSATPTPRLIGEFFSPWTEKARWALEHHRVAYAYHEYQPLIDEPWLRLKTRNFTRRMATVPALLDGGRSFPDSFLIARYAEERGGGAPLFPSFAQTRIEAFNNQSEAALRAGRALLFTRLTHNRAALLDYVPTFVPAPVRPLLRPLVRLGIGYIRAKHRIDAAMVAKAYDTLDAALASLREALAGRRYLLGTLTYADLAMAVVCQFVKPVDSRYIPLSEASRACWTESDLARKHADLFDWRDELYAIHRDRDGSASVALRTGN